MEDGGPVLAVSMCTEPPSRARCRRGAETLIPAPKLLENAPTENVGNTASGN